MGAHSGWALPRRSPEEPGGIPAEPGGRHVEHAQGGREGDEDARKPAWQQQL